MPAALNSKLTKLDLPPGVEVLSVDRFAIELLDGGICMARWRRQAGHLEFSSEVFDEFSSRCFRDDIAGFAQGLNFLRRYLDGRTPLEIIA